MLAVIGPGKGSLMEAQRRPEHMVVEIVLKTKQH